MRALFTLLSHQLAALLIWLMLIACWVVIWLLDRVYALLGWLAQDEREEREHWEAHR